MKVKENLDINNIKILIKLAFVQKHLCKSFTWKEKANSNFSKSA